MTTILFILAVTAMAFLIIRAVGLPREREAEAYATVRVPVASPIRRRPLRRH